MLPASLLGSRGFNLGYGVRVSSSVRIYVYATDPRSAEKNRERLRAALLIYIYALYALLLCYWYNAAAVATERYDSLLKFCFRSAEWLYIRLSNESRMRDRASFPAHIIYLLELFQVLAYAWTPLVHRQWVLTASRPAYLLRKISITLWSFISYLFAVGYEVVCEVV